MSITWTYNPSISTDTDRVRLLVGDTNADAPLLDDGAIAFFLTQGGGVFAAAALAAESLAGRYAGDVTRKVGGTGASISASDRFAHFTALAAQLRASAATAASSTPMPYAGGLSIAEKAAACEDTDLVPPAFRVDL